MSLVIRIKRAARRILYLKYKHGKNKLGYLGEHVSIPNDIVMAGERNIFIDNDVSLGNQTTMHAMNAKITIKQGSVAAKGLKISTGNHERRIGRFVSTIKESEKNHSIGLDKDVVIEEDVWLGFNVVVLSGVTIGRGCTIAAGSVVSKSTCPYSIWGGVPAKFIKFYWTIDEIQEHEKILYTEQDRLTKEYLSELFLKYENKE